MWCCRWNLWLYSLKLERIWHQFAWRWIKWWEKCDCDMTCCDCDVTVYMVMLLCTWWRYGVHGDVTVYMVMLRCTCRRRHLLCAWIIHAGLQHFDELVNILDSALSGEKYGDYITEGNHITMTTHACHMTTHACHRLLQWGGHPSYENSSQPQDDKQACADIAGISCQSSLGHCPAQDLLSSVRSVQSTSSKGWEAPTLDEAKHYIACNEGMKTVKCHSNTHLLAMIII